MFIMDCSSTRRYHKIELYKDEIKVFPKFFLQEAEGVGSSVSFNGLAAGSAAMLQLVSERHKLNLVLFVCWEAGRHKGGRVDLGAIGRT